MLVSSEREMRGVKRTRPEEKAFESVGGGNRLVKKTKEHLEAEKSLRGRTGEELEEAERNLAKQRRGYRARRTMQETQKVKNKQAGLSSIFCEEGETTIDR